MTDVQAGNFAEFLKYIAGDGSVEELILVGDMLDDWVYPIDLLPPQYSEIAAARQNPVIMDLLRQIAQDKTKSVTYLVGNHDMTMAKDLIANFGNGACANITFQEYYETQDGILAQHGHQFSMYNASDPAHKLPMGHYISRLYASTGVRGRWQDEIAGALTNALKGVPNPFVNAPLSYLAGKLNINDGKPIVTIDGGPETLGGIRLMYEDLPVRWEKSNGLLGPIESALEETSEGLGLKAEDVAKTREKKVIIFGHTHSAKINYIYRWFNSEEVPSETTKIAIYANCGSWCQENAEYTYVVDEYEEGTGKHRVTLMRWLPTSEQVDQLSIM